MNRAARPLPWRSALAAALAMLGAAFAGPASATVVQTGRVAAELTPETASVAPGGAVVIALHQKIAPGWHTYWRNPGDAGQATTITWSLPPGWTAGDIVWPAPERFLAGPIMNYVYTDEVYLPVRLTAPASAPAGEATLKASAAWLVCKDVCIPEHADLSVDVRVRPGAAALNPDGGAAVAAALAHAPKPAGLTARFRLEGAKVALSVSGAALKGLAVKDAYFYPFDGTLLDQASPQEVSAASGEAITLTLPAGYGLTHGKPPARLDGVLSLGGRAFEVDARASGAATAAPMAASSSSNSPTASSGPGSSPTGRSPLPHQPGEEHSGPGSASTAAGLLGALAFAFVGGLILNLMPCVFPVLSMKAAALARHVEAPAEARREGLAFMAGVVTSLMGLAVLLVLARAAGQAVGWGFQLQSPAVVAALALVMLATGLNLSGVFEIGASLQGVGAEAAARRSGLAGAALTGALAVVVAAPCTAPFMAPAIGWALVQPPAEALVVFLALAIGLAAPFTLLSFAPGLFRRLPRPGAWMDGLRKVLAFPMYGAAAWLAWVFALQTGAAALPALFASALAVAFGGFCWGVAQRSERRAAPAAAGVLALLAGGAALAGGLNAPPLPSTGAAALTSPGAGGLAAAQPWSPARVAELQRGGRPVFVDFTAAWCVTCQVNERTALSDGAVNAAFARTRAAYLKADWTRPDPQIARALSAQGRSGVPMYLVYPRAGGAPRILPQLLTPATVAAALDRASRG